MASGSKYTPEEISRMLEDSDHDWDFSESDDDYIPNESEDSDTSESEAEDMDLSNEVHVSEDDLMENVGGSEKENSVVDFEEGDNMGEPQLHPLWEEDILPIGREIFTGKSGVLDVQSIYDESGDISVMKIYEYLVSNDLIELMVNKTNNYANMLKNSRSGRYSRMKRWTDVDSTELKKFFAIILLMGIDKKPSIEHYWKMDTLYYNQLFHNIAMSYNRFS